MGRTKRVAELLLHGMNGGRATKYLAVRFGNVLESSGSVIPLFREQIERGGPVTVTHPDVTRLFMTIPEAVQLILQAAPMSKGGETFVLDMGHPIRILDLAKALIRLYGLTPGQDIEIVFTGLRAGERLFEKLVNDHEKVWKTSHPKILMAVSEGSKGRAQEEIQELVSALEAAPGGCAPAKLLELPKPHATRTPASKTRENLSGSPVGLN
jgi:FlaA1/EpsC-like NDP-sugar epimerase